MIGWQGFIVVALATYRVARIVTTDSISLPFRERLYGWAWDDDHAVTGADGLPYATPRAAWRTWVHDLLTCALCFGVWTAAGLYALWRWSDSPAVRSGLVVLALAGLQCFLASRADA